MKKIVSMLLFLAVGITLFSGCSTSDVGIYTKQDLLRERYKTIVEYQLKEAQKQKQSKAQEVVKPVTKHYRLFQCNYRNKVTYKIVTGSKTGTYYQIGKDLAKYVAPKACINLEVLSSNGSVENVRRLAKEKGVKLAIVQSDVFQQFKEFANNGNKMAKEIIRNLRVIKPLYFEEVHFIVRKNSPANYIQDIKNLRINIGPMGSGTSITTSSIYKELFSTNIPLQNRFHYGYTEALKRLLRNDLDVVVYVSGQPTKRLDMPASAKNLIKLLEYSNSSPYQTNSYYQTKIFKTSYKWLDHNVNTLAVKSYLITFNYKGSARRALARFAKELHDELPLLKRDGHPKWKTVSDRLNSLPGGWKYYSVSKFAYYYNFDGSCHGMAKDLKLCY